MLSESLRAVISQRLVPTADETGLVPAIAGGQAQAPVEVSLEYERYPDVETAEGPFVFRGELLLEGLRRSGLPE